jgi:hypothetical protein
MMVGIWISTAATSVRLVPYLLAVGSVPGQPAMREIMPLTWATEK